MKAYFISGLGADRRAFQNLVLPSGLEVVHLDWIPPYARESLASYAQRLSARIQPQEPFVLVGLSLGGMIAAEIAAQLSPLQTLLISSIPSSRQLPRIYRILGAVGLHRYLPIRVMKSGMFIKRLFMNESFENRQLILKMVQEADPHFVRWALQAVLGWKRVQVPKGIVQIHGDKDELFPIRKIISPKVITGGRHLMVLNQAPQVSQLLQEALQPVMAMGIQNRGGQA